MIPITVSFFAQRAEGNKGGSGLKDATAYALGIIAFFTGLGFIFSLIFGPAGIQEFAKNPWVYLFIGGIFIMFTFNLLGAFEIQMPTGMMNKLNKKSQTGKGIAAVLIMSLTFSLASFSCTGPFVGAVLMSASQGEWFYPIIGMLSFSTVLAAPFFLLALFPAALTSMPRAGAWMNNIKIVMAFIVLPTSLYFISNAFVDFGIGFLTREVFLSIAAMCMLMNFLYLLGVFKTDMDASVQHLSVTRMFLALVFGALTLFLMSGLFGRQLGELETFLPQSETSVAVAGGTASHAEWLTNYDEALVKAKAENKPIFIDFTGKKCTNCKKMERTIFPQAMIAERF
ncbi:MAG: thioredoxin family protein, partial [Chlorobi bacterium]|nr:thioredoxin family protein [Chlorobiota bacterium]